MYATSLMLFLLQVQVVQDHQLPRTAAVPAKAAGMRKAAGGPVETTLILMG